MKVIHGCLLLFLTVCIFNYSYAQTTSSVIRGNIFLQNNIAADAATVVLLKQADSSVVMSALVDGRGAFEFPVKPGAYLLLATRLGYKKTYSAPFTLAAGKIITVPSIYLQPASTDLKEVAIVAKKPFVEVKPGKTVINPQASITADGKNALDILAQSPGVRVDNNDNISISGRQNALVLIDGKTTGMTGADLAAMLKSTQGSNIDRIELIKSGSAKYDAAAGGVVNIVLKKGKNIGTNGTINITAGYGKYYKAVGGITFNNRSKYVNIYGSYNVNANKTYKRFTNDRNINSAGALSSYDLTYYGLQESISYNYRLGADFSLSPKSTLGVLVYGFVNNNDFTKSNRLNIANQGSLDSSIFVNSKVNRDLRNINYNINYSGSLKKAGQTLSAGVTYSPYTRHSDEYIVNTFLNSAGAPYRAPSFLQNLSPSDRYNITGLIDFTSPLSKTSKLEAGLKYSHTKSNNVLLFGPLVNGVYTSDATFSNTFVYKEDVSAAYLNYNTTIGKVDVVAGLRGEYTRSEGNSMTANLITERNYFKLFPNLLLTYHKNDKNDFTLSFMRGILRPDYDNLNPFLYYIDPYNYQSGNPYLKPEFSNSLRLSHTYNQVLTTTLYAGYISDANFVYYQQNDATRVNLTTTRNIGTVKSLGINVNAQVPVTKWWNGLFDVDASYMRYKVYPENGTLDKGTGDVIISTTQNFALNKILALELSGRYETPNLYGIRQFRINYYINGGISAQVLKKMGKISLTVSDIFNTDRDRAHVNFNNLDLDILQKRETRIARLNFTYRFGKSTVKSAAKHNTGNEDEQNRMRRSSN